MILDVSETAMFLTSYPRLHRQPYSMHIQIENCMFGRQMEMELVLNFLLYTPPCSSRLDRFDVLPIVGPRGCGKSTLVAHVCNDERVRDHFTQIAFFRHGTFRDEDISILTDGCTMRHVQNRKLLIVFEVVGELKDDLWQRLCSLSTSCTASGSKIIITSRSDKIAKLGTTQTLTLKDLPHEAFWYFFKVITFGSTDPGMHPRLTYLAMEISKMLKGSLGSANLTARVLRADFSIQHWCKILKFTRGSVKKHSSMVGEHPHDRLNESKHAYLRRLGGNSADFLISGEYQTCSSQEELPEITLQDVLYGGVKPQGTFKVLAWKSPLPPYRCYICTCEIQQLQTRVVKRRRSLNNSGH
jgi:energy-coupling factor transporter ATP-binding protein EcfA2